MDNKKTLFLYRIVTILMALIIAMLACENKAQAKPSLRTVRCDESKMIEIYVRPKFSTVINFPIKPDNVFLGGKNQFGLEYIKNDIALTALTLQSKTNVFVYMLGRRCGFELIASSSRHDNLILVRDPEETKMKIPFE